MICELSCGMTRAPSEYSHFCYSHVCVCAYDCTHTSETSATMDDTARAFLSAAFCTLKSCSKRSLWRVSPSRQQSNVCHTQSENGTRLS